MILSSSFLGEAVDRLSIKDMITKDAIAKIMGVVTTKINSETPNKRAIALGTAAIAADAVIRIQIVTASSNTSLMRDF